MTADAPDKEKNGKIQFGVQSVEIGLRVLAVLAESYQPMMLRDLAKAMGMPSAKVHRYLVSLARGGMVEQEGTGARYSLGPLALSVGFGCITQLEVVKICGAAAADLRDRTDLTVLLASGARPTDHRALGGVPPANCNQCSRGIGTNPSGVCHWSRICRILAKTRYGRKTGRRNAATTMTAMRLKSCWQKCARVVSHLSAVTTDIN